jgi:hypothetical protein
MARRSAEHKEDVRRVLNAFDPASVTAVVESLLKTPVGRAVDVLIHALGRAAGGEHASSLTNVEACVRAVASGSEVAAASLRRQCAGRGRCPKELRSRLRAWLPSASPSPSLPVAAIESRMAVAREPGTVLDLSDEQWTLTRLPGLIDRLGRARSKRGDRVVVRLGPFAYASALAILATWATRLGLDLELESDPGMEAYLGRIRFHEALASPHILVTADPTDWAVGLTRINRDVSTERVTGKIIQILDTFVQPAREDRDGLTILIAEMIENVHRHAQPDTDGFAVAQLYPKQLKLGVTLVDGGIGVSGSFRTSTVMSERLASCHSDRDYLLAACELHVTSKPDRHSGYGLYILSQLISRNRGSFLLGSDTCSVIGYQRRGALHFDTYSHAPWQGTIISAIIDLHNPLPIGDVYRSMPVPEGEDFFD